jgi:hypothetical protein
MISEVYDAFIEAGATSETARKAAEAIAAYEVRFATIESELRLIRWTQGILIALGVATVVRLYIP